jgi:peptidoglycan/xylan/chitin deacetylase (PgdA/CDA1 family)
MAPRPLSFTRRAANRSLDLLFAPAFDRVWRRRLLGKVMCVLYHRVGPRGAVPYLDRFGAPPIAQEELSRELDILRSRGARFMTFAGLRNGEFPDGSEFGVIVSFDDGFRDNYAGALDVLDSLGIRATIFQSTAMVDAPTLIWEHALYWYWDQPRMRDALIELAHQRIAASRASGGDALLAFLRDALPAAEVESLLAEMSVRFECGPALREQARLLYPARQDLIGAQARGHEIASHGHHHYRRGCLDATAFEGELRRSSSALTEILGQAPAAFAYPFNDHQSGDETICGRHFVQAATVDGALIERNTPPLSLPRFTWPGPHRNALRRSRWLWTGSI